MERVGTATEERLGYEFTAEGVRWLRVTLRLPAGSPVLQIENRFSKPATMTKESAYLAFPFAVREPTVRYEISGGVTGADLTHVPGAPQHMRAVRTWVSFDGPDQQVAWATRDAPLVHPETIALPYAPFPESTAPREPATIYSWVHNNIWDTNFPPQQSFEASFHYAVGVARAGDQLSTAALAMRTAAELTNPLLGVAAGGPVAEVPAEQSLLQLDDDRVRVVSLAAVDDQPDQVLVRLQSYATEPVRVRLRPRLSTSAAVTATYLGDPLARVAVTDGEIEVPIPRLGTAAVRLDLAARCGGPHDEGDQP